jgi:RNA polymerase primary sigma factor
MADDSNNDTESSELPAGVEDDLMRRYFRDFAAIPLLSREEEVELSRQIKAGSKPAFDRLVQSNLRLVVKIVWQCRRRRYGIPLLDLVQDGNLGLMRAAEDFDGNRGCKFSTYASWWVRSFVLRGPFTEGGSMHIPHSMRKKIARMRKAIRVFSQEKRREPTDPELAEWMDITIEKLWKIRRAAEQPISLHTPVSKEVGTRDTLGDRLTSPDAPTLSADMERAELHDQLKQIASLLTKRELRVIKLRFGLEDGKEWTLQEIGDKLEVTRERIRQIQNQALGKLRDSSLGKALADLLY